ncbi:MAG: DUF669 domain-containing protein [Gemmataceae bacterium]
MADLGGFNAADVEPAESFGLIPRGPYVAVISQSEMKNTKRGDGQYLELTFQITEGGFKNRLLWARLNLDNPNPKAVEIARAELSAICRAVGVLQPRDSVDLHNLPLGIEVAVRKREDTGENTNEIKGYFKLNSSTPSPNTPSDTTPPWKR